MNHIPGSAFLGLALLMLATPCIADEDTVEETAEAPAKVCVNSRTIRSFDALSDEHVFIEERSKTYFLMTMDHRCSGLRHANGIAIKDATSRVCSNGFGEIMFRDGPMGMTTCRIGTIEAVESKDQAKAIIAEREAAEDESKKD